MFLKKGSSLPPGSGRDGHPRRYAEIVSLALKSELDDTRRIVKTVHRWTGASERTIRNWMSGAAGPNGDHLIAILSHSDTMLQMILIASRRLDFVEMLMTRSNISDDDKNTRPRRNADDHQGRGYSPPPHVPERVPDDDSEHVPDGDFAPNDRQRWFLAELAGGNRVSVRSLRDHFCVAEKTAKRDIASLKANRLISFVGTRRKGRYRLLPTGSPRPPSGDSFRR